jgi:hypothetical protein
MPRDRLDAKITNRSHSLDYLALVGFRCGKPGNLISFMRSANFPKIWSRWSREDLSGEFERLLGGVTDGGTDFAECLATAGRIDLTSDESWCRAWAQVADQTKALADTALDQGRTDIAATNWLRAINYYQAAAFPLDGVDERAQGVVARMQACAGAFLRCRKPQAEVVTIPWRADYPLEGYFLPAASAPDKAPAVLCFSEPGRRKEGCLAKLALLAAERGLSFLFVDVMGPRGTNRFDDIVGSRDLESAVGSAMDFLAARDDIDEDRIAVLAHEWGSSFVARGIALDQRYAVAVCDGGLWDIQERSFLAQRMASRDASVAASIRRASRVARHILCPVLIAVKEQGWLNVDHAAALVEEMRADHSDITLKVFAGGRGNVGTDAPTNEFILDWIAGRLRSGPAAQG